MFAVGIDISKSKSVAAILNQDGSMHTSPFEFHHYIAFSKIHNCCGFNLMRPFSKRKSENL